MYGDKDSIINALKTGKFCITVHASTRMRQRSVTKADIMACGQTAISCLYQSDLGTWRVEGADLDGETLTVVCGMDEDATIVTIF